MQRKDYASFRPQIGVISEINVCYDWYNKGNEFPSPNWGYLWNIINNQSSVPKGFRPQIGVISEIIDAVICDFGDVLGFRPQIGVISEI